MLPDGFKLAPQERWTEEIKEETEGVYFTNYSEEKIISSLWTFTWRY